MAFEIKGLREKRAKISADQRALLELAEAENRGLNAEEKAQDAAYDAEYTAISERIDRLEKQEARDAELALRAADSQQSQHGNIAPSLNEETRATALQGWMRAQSGLEVTDQHRAAMGVCGVRAGSNYLDLNLTRNADYGNLRREFRTGMSTTDALGGYTIPTGFVANFESALLAFGGPRQVADIIRTDSGNDLPWPTANDSGNKGELLAEETSIGSTVNPTVGVKTFGAYKMSSKLIQVSPELLQDSAFDMASQIGAWLGERIGRIEADYYTTGSGSSQPQGIVTGATSAFTSASATAITPEELLDLIHSVDPAYRAGSVFMMNDAVLKYFRKLKDGNGAYIWVPGLQAGQSDTLLGYPVVVNQSMASSLTATYKSVLFGQMKKFKIRDVANIRLRRLVERYADTDQEGFVAFHRTDSGLLDAGTHPVKYITQHS